MNKIGILTLYDSLNFGTFLQAFALSEYLKNEGHEVYFIKNNKKNNYLKWIISKNIKRILFNILQVGKYHKSQKYFYEKNFKEKFDNIIIGSDEIWNIKNPTFLHHKKYFGYNLNSKNIIAYAPSCNNVTAVDLKKFYNNNINLDKFDSLSVRDESTAKLLMDLGYNNFERVIDPTFLIIDEYDKILVKNNMNNYILVYGYSFKKNQIEQIKTYAKKKHKKLIAIGLYQPWCDLNVTASPYEFLGYVKNADNIITSTFHGTVFSIIFNKQFASFSNEKKKIQEILKLFSLKNRDAMNNNLEEIFCEKISYQNINKIIKERRNISIKFLKNAIKN